jgi:RNA polymerase sigma-70 factor (ECF subfamily)
MSPPPRQEEFEALLEAHRGILHKVANTYCRNLADREDLVQEIAVQLWRSFPRFDGRCRFSTWAYRIALNVAISHARQESARARHTVPAEDRHVEIADEPGPPAEELQLLHSFIEGLDGLYKALALLYLDGNSHQEIAEVLGISATNVATKIARLKERLRQSVLPA